jgi:ATP-dependent Clp protease adaptor protein ClpS
VLQRLGVEPQDRQQVLALLRGSAGGRFPRPPAPQCAPVDSRRPNSLTESVATQTQAPTRKRREARTGGGAGDAWRVIVLNDNHNTFQGVAFALASVIPGVSYEQGLRIADKIHNSGQSVVWSGHRELAELYWNELKNRGLTMAPLER